VRLLLALLALALAGCTQDQSKAIGSAPKKTLDRVESDVSKALQQGADRSREEK
jgi:outer membrane lipoprotein-sorting protein